MAKNVYIHIPFCKGKCNYCSFVSFDKLELKEAYLEALKNEILYYYKGETLNTLYVGGGTPSLLTVDELKNIIELFNLESDAEITVEVNPDSSDLLFLQGLKNIGVNRLSIGAQTFNDNILKLIGRRHYAQQTRAIVFSGKAVGFNNISLDLIYGLPGQRLSEFENDLKRSIELDVQHISLYGLKIEENCNFYKNPPIAPVPDLDAQADMYLKAVEILKANRFIHYEVSNFTKTGFASIHNLNYWDNNSYYGFGCSASGYVDRIRYTNQIDLEKYIENPVKKISEHKLNEHEILEEAIFLGFRKIAGIDTSEINQKFDINFDEKYAKILNKFKDYFIKTPRGWALNTDGIMISNEILSEFID